jgi:hypothetical protein
MNLLIEHHVRLLELKTEGDRSHYAAGPSDIEMTLRYPGRRRLEAVVAALNRASFGCREVYPSTDVSEKE